MTVFNQTKHLLYRNYLLKIRNKKETFQEIFLPVFFMAILAGIRSTTDVRDEPAIEREDIPKYSLLRDFPLFSNIKNSIPTVAFVSNDLRKARDVLNILKAYAGGRVNFTESNSVADMTKSYRTQKEKFHFGIVFEASNTSYLGIKYTVLSPYKSQPSTLQKIVKIDRCRDTTQNFVGGYNCPVNDYLIHGIVTFQAVIDAAFRAVGESKWSLTEPDIALQMMPKPKFQTSLKGFFITVALYIAMSFAPIVSVLLINLVREKESKIKESMKIMGMKTLAFWFAWSIIYLFILLFVCLLMLAISIPSKIFGNSNAFCVFLFLYLYGISLVTMSFMLTPFFKKAKVAGALGSVSTLIFGVMTLPVTLFNFPVALKWLISLLSPAALTLGLSKGASVGDGLQFSNLFDNQESFPSGNSLVMLVVDIILYMMLALYFDAVVPGEYGQRRVPYFCLLPSFWKGLLGWTAADEDQPLETIDSMGDVQRSGDIEPVPVELSGKQAIRISHLRKVFKVSKKEDVVAVNDVSLDIYEGQITALLGHNGAGKTTLLSILTGLIPSTSGTAMIYGHDINSANGQERIREMTGICPQQNILFDNLTSFEHLRFFAGIKGIPQERVELEIETLLNDVDLANERDTFAKNLSGGQKRKLCLAVSLIGDPKVVFLDEPTSGMDPYSRRSVWALLKRKSKDCVIFMTTHFMDEADILADYKAIMSNGKLRTAGSSLFLKNRFGIGYHLNMTIDDSCDVSAMTQLVQSHVSGANVAGDYANELRYTLPLDGVHQFADLFSVLEKSNSSDEICTAPALGVKSYSVSMTTLEEVFLKLGNEDPEPSGGDEDENDDRLSQDSVCTVDALGDVDRTNINIFKHAPEVNTSRFFVQRQQFKAILKILFLSSLRSPMKVFFHICLPPVLVLAGLLVSRARSSESVDITRKLELSPSLYLTHASTESYAAPLVLRNSTALIGNLVTELKKRNVQSQVVTSFAGLLKTFPHSIAFDSIKMSKIESTYSLLYNDSTIHALPLAINIADSVVVSILRNVSSVIETYVQAFPNLEEVFTFDAVAFNSALLMGLALTIIPGGFAITVVMFKELRCQHQLRVSGVSAMVYWGTFFVFDFLTLTIPVVLILILVPAFGAKSYLVPGAMGALILAMFLYMNLAIVLSYVLSFIFTSWQTTSAVTPSLYSMAAMLGYLTVSLVDLIHYQDNPDLPIILHCVFLVIDPPYAIMGALYYIDRVYRVESIRQQSLDVTPATSKYFTWTKGNGVPAALLVPAIQLVFFTSLLFYLDLRSRGKKINWPWMKCFRQTSNVASLESKFERSVDVTLDDDVAAERERIMDESFDISSDNHAVVSKGVWKIFRKKKVLKVVVQDLNFCVDSGEIFALLGPNGAGKTTFMNIVTCHYKPNAGKVFVAGNDISSNVDQAYGHLGYCPQTDALWEEITLEEHLHCYAHVKGVSPIVVKDVVDCFMTAMKIKGHRKKRVKNLSGGTKRKLQFGISLLGDPKLLLLDEPSSGMDPKSRRFLWEMIQQNIRGGRGAILTTHSMEEADAVSSRVGIMVKGKMKAIGPTQHLKNRFGSGFTLEVKLSPTNRDVEERFEALDGYIKENFPGAQISENFGLRASYKVPRSGVVALSNIFTALEKGKQIVSIEEYSFSQTTLEQVFLELAREQDDDRTGKSEDQ